MTQPLAHLASELSQCDQKNFNQAQQAIRNLEEECGIYKEAFLQMAEELEARHNQIAELTSRLKTANVKIISPSPSALDSKQLQDRPDISLVSTETGQVAITDPELQKISHLDGSNFSGILNILKNLSEVRDIYKNALGQIVSQIQESDTQISHLQNQIKDEEASVRAPAKTEKPSLHHHMQNNLEKLQQAMQTNTDHLLITPQEGPFIVLNIVLAGLQKQNYKLEEAQAECLSKEIKAASQQIGLPDTPALAVLLERKKEEQINSEINKYCSFQKAIRELNTFQGIQQLEQYIFKNFGRLIEKAIKAATDKQKNFPLLQRFPLLVGNFYAFKYCLDDTLSRYKKLPQTPKNKDVLNKHIEELGATLEALSKVQATFEALLQKCQVKYFA